MLGKDYEGQDCLIARALEVVGERWTLLIVRDALYGVRRFSDFHSHLDIPKAVLSERLTGLVEQGILERRPDPDHRSRYLYEPTAAGRDLWPVVHSLFRWSEQNRAPSNRRFRHALCGTELDQTGTCPSCRITPAVEDVTMEPRRGRGSSRTDPVAVALMKPHRLLEPLEVAQPSAAKPDAKRS
jgi:DNA-binding HxlR family transcriptional regulator